MPIDQIKDKVVTRVTDSIANRLLRNAGVEDIIDHPKRYKVELTFEDEGVTLKIRKKTKQ